MKTILFTLKSFNKSGGGGCFFVENLGNYLKKNFNVIYELQPNIDIIIIIDPRKNSTNNYTIDEILKYKKKNPNTKIIHRVNECDIKRDKSINIEPLLTKTMKNADLVVFISKWLQDYYINKYNLDIKSYTYILNGCNEKNFYNIKDLNNSINTKKIKIVTHHWSNNYLKGFHIYNKLDKILSTRKDIEFTFIGNYNKNYNPENIILKKPIHGKILGEELRKHDIYLTATQNEPCGMHHIEGISCGLPILYCSGGGAIKEMCGNVGEEYHDIDDFFVKLQKIIDNYEKYVENINYDFLSSERCSRQYLNEINNL